jgi:hypothetical protein
MRPRLLVAGSQKDHLRRILEEAQTIVSDALAADPREKS